MVEVRVMSLSLDDTNYELHNFAISFYMYGGTPTRWGSRERHDVRVRLEREIERE
jgi:hypothetical protein